MTTFRCNTCKKNYASYQSLWIHNKKFHKNEEEHKNIMSTLCKHNVNIMSTLCKHNVNISETKEERTYTCKYCLKKYNYRQSKSRHEKTCKSKSSDDNILRTENQELKNQLKEVLQTLKIHPKTLKKINNNIINTNNNITNNIQNNNIQNNNIQNNNIQNNNIQNNNITIVKFGTEYLSELLTNNEMKYIISRIENSLRESIKQVHFNDNRPEYKNIYITNIHDNLAYVYNGKKFEATNKMNALSELMRTHIDNIDEYISNEDNEISEYKMKHINKLIERVNIELNSDTIKHLREVNRIKEFIYNNSNKKMLSIQNTK